MRGKARRVGVHTQSRLTLCHPMDCGLLVSPVREILQSRILQWVAIFSPREISPHSLLFSGGGTFSFIPIHSFNGLFKEPWCSCAV